MVKALKTEVKNEYHFRKEMTSKHMNQLLISSAPYCPQGPTSVIDYLGHVFIGSCSVSEGNFRAYN